MENLIDKMIGPEFGDYYQLVPLEYVPEHLNIEKWEFDQELEILEANGYGRAIGALLALENYPGLREENLEVLYVMDNGKVGYGESVLPIGTKLNDQPNLIRCWFEEVDIDIIKSSAGKDIYEDA